MMRALLLALLLANAALLAANLGLLDRLRPVLAGRQREPERLALQQHPERIALLPAGAASALPAASQGAAPASNASSAATERATACLQAGPFDAAQAAVAERSLAEAGVARQAWQAVTAPEAGVRSVWRIVMGPYADPEQQRRKHDELGRLKVEAGDWSDPAQPPGHGPSLLLGRYADARAAEAALARLRQRGVHTAKVVGQPEAAAVVLRLHAADAATQARVAGLRMPSGPGMVPCPLEPSAASSTRR